MSKEQVLTTKLKRYIIIIIMLALGLSIYFVQKIEPESKTIVDIIPNESIIY